jgi:hypothetical protein
MLFSMFGLMQTASAQTQELNRVVSDPDHKTGQLPTFFEKDSMTGSPYLSPNWMVGVLEMANNRKILKSNQSWYFNYDKFYQRVIVMNKENTIWSYPVDSVLGFVLADGDKIYSFEKFSSISSHFFLETVVKSENGYSLFRRLITQLRTANYKNEGYSQSGEKHDAFIDSYEYYLLFPNKRKFEKFYLEEKKVRRVFKHANLPWADLNKSSSFTEQDLVSLIDAINERK